jgi:hypothetical protein
MNLATSVCGPLRSLRPEYLLCAPRRVAVTYSDTPQELLAALTCNSPRLSVRLIDSQTDVFAFKYVMYMSSQCQAKLFYIVP